MPFPAPPPAPLAPPRPTFPPAAAPTYNPEGRNLLLQSIQNGTTLKKTVTNDKSAPLLQVRPNNSGERQMSSQPFPVTARQSSSSGLGGIFAGGMPQLRPTRHNTIRPNNSGERRRSPQPFPVTATQSSSSGLGGIFAGGMPQLRPTRHNTTQNLTSKQSFQAATMLQHSQESMLGRSPNLKYQTLPSHCTRTDHRRPPPPCQEAPPPPQRVPVQPQQNLSSDSSTSLNRDSSLRNGLSNSFSNKKPTIPKKPDILKKPIITTKKPIITKEVMFIETLTIPHQSVPNQEDPTYRQPLVFSHHSPPPLSKNHTLPAPQSVPNQVDPTFRQPLVFSHHSPPPLSKNHTLPAPPSVPNQVDPTFRQPLVFSHHSPPPPSKNHTLPEPQSVPNQVDPTLQCLVFSQHFPPPTPNYHTTPSLETISDSLPPPPKKNPPPPPPRVRQQQTPILESVSPAPLSSSNRDSSMCSKMPTGFSSSFKARFTNIPVVYDFPPPQRFRNTVKVYKSRNGNKEKKYV